MPLNGQFLDKSGLTYLWSKLKTKFAAKQDSIADLTAIRSGAAAGATALQQSDVSSTYSASGTAPVNGTAVNAAIGTLDVSSVGGSGKYISAISETNGKISATPTTFDTSLSSSSTDGNVPTTKTVYDDQQRQEVEIGAVANRGAKNLFKNTAVSKTYQGVVFTVNEDGTVSLSGAATTAAGVLEIGTVTPPAGSYIVSGCPAGGSWSPNPKKYRIRIAKNGAWLGDETGSGYTVTVNGSDVISLQINSSVGVDTAGLVFKPMLRLASITDSTFQPYAKTNRELTVAEDEDRAALVQQYEMVQQCYDFIFGVGAALQSYSDLNDYKAPGKVIAVNGAIAATIANTPWTQSGFTAFTIPNLTLTSCMQFVLPNTMAGKWYRRRYMQDTWSPWTEYDGTQVATT